MLGGTDDNVKSGDPGVNEVSSSISVVEEGITIGAVCGADAAGCRGESCAGVAGGGEFEASVICCC